MEPTTEVGSHGRRSSTNLEGRGERGHGTGERVANQERDDADHGEAAAQRAAMHFEQWHPS